MIAHGGGKNVSPEKRAWAQEMVSKSEGMPIGELPVRATPKYSGLSRRKRGISTYGK